MPKHIMAVHPGRSLFAGLAIALLFTASCEPPPTTICTGIQTCQGDLIATTVDLTPIGATLTSLGATVQMAATVFDQIGGVIDTATVSWATSAPNVASVDANGLVTATENGQTLITAQSRAATDTVTVTVAQTPSAVVVTPDPVTLPAPTSAALLSVSVTDAGGSPIIAPVLTWSSDDEAIATVIQEGVVTGVAAGTTDVRVDATAGGQTASSSTSVTVNASTPGMVLGLVRDAVTGVAINNAAVNITGPGTNLNTTTDAAGGYMFASMAGGTYTVTASNGGFDSNTAMGLQVADGTGDVVRADFALPPTGSPQRFGGLSGRVFFGGAPLADATVSISGGTQTNGIFQSTTTDQYGTYSLVGMGLDDTDGNPITQFTVISTFGFSAAQASVTPVQNQTLPNVDLNLVPNQGLTAYFQDDFETTGKAWTTTGFWNRSTLGGVSNDAYPDFVNLAPGDDSNGALPAPVQGQYAYWYGDPAAGNFLGPQTPGDANGSGGTSVDPNSGTLTSEVFSIPAGATDATLRFSTWFEIESVNPNASGFDVMTIAVIEEGATGATDLVRLNPFVDPTLANRIAIPFTSGGFNLPPVWRTEFVDLSAYIGQNIQLVFEFETVDGLYNGFRGWLIDDVSVTNLPSGVPTLAPANPNASPPAARTHRAPGSE